MSLELKHISPYLPFGVNFISSMDDSDDTIELNKIWTLDGINKLFGDYCLLTKENNDAYDIKSCKLLLRPLSDLTKEDFSLFMSLYGLTKSEILESDIDYLPHGLVNFFYSYHFDIHNLIDEKEAVDINTLNQEL